jgi:nucleoside-diphosphate-sugar epimerase
MNHYRDTKAESTRQAIAFAKRQCMNLTVLEPVWVYGENEFNSGFYEYLKTAVSGFPFMPGCRTNTFHVIYAGELARAYYLAFQKELTGIHRLIIGNQEPESMQSIYEGLCREAGVKKPGNIPKWIIYPLAVAMESISYILKWSSPPLLTRSRVNMFYDSIGFSTINAEKILGFSNQVDLKTGIHKTVQWYKKNNLL